MTGLVEAADGLLGHSAVRARAPVVLYLAGHSKLLSSAQAAGGGRWADEVEEPPN